MWRHVIPRISHDPKKIWGLIILLTVQDRGLVQITFDSVSILLRMKTSISF